MEEAASITEIRFQSGWIMNLNQTIGWKIAVSEFSKPRYHLRECSKARILFTFHFENDAFCFVSLLPAAKVVCNFFK